MDTLINVLYVNNTLGNGLANARVIGFELPYVAAECLVFMTYSTNRILQEYQSINTSSLRMFEPVSQDNATTQSQSRLYDVEQ